MKRAFIICLTASFLLVLVLMFVGCKPSTTNNPEDTFTDADPIASNGEIQDGEEWIDEIDPAPSADETTEGEQPTEPESTGDVQDDLVDAPATDGGDKPTDPPSTSGGDKPTDPPVTNSTDKPTEAPTQDTKEDAGGQTTQGGIDLPAIPG